MEETTVSVSGRPVEEEREYLIPPLLYAHAGKELDGTYDYVSASTEIPCPRQKHKVGVYKLIRIIEVQGETKILSDVAVD